MKQEDMYFQDEPLTEVSDLIYDLGQRIKKEFDEPILGEFLINQALQYRTGSFKAQYLQMLELADLLKESEEEEAMNDLFDSIEFGGGKVH